MGSFLVGSFALTKEQQEKDNIALSSDVIKSTEYVVGKYFAVVAYSLLVTASFILLPFLLSFRMKNIGYTGSPVAYWRYFLLWIIPTMSITLILQMLMSLCLKEKEAGIIVHFLTCLIMASTNNTYQLYRFVIRFDGVDENFYKGVSDSITINRIFISCITIIMLFVTIYIFKMKQKRSGNIG